MAEENRRDRTVHLGDVAVGFAHRDRPSRWAPHHHPPRARLPAYGLAHTSMRMPCRPFRAAAGSARRVRPCPRASACRCRMDGTPSRSRRAARASWTASGTRCRTSNGQSRERTRDGYRASFFVENSSSGFGRYVASRDNHRDDFALDIWHLVREQSADSGSRSRLRCELRALVEEAKAGANVVVRDENRLHPELGADLKREVACHRRVERIRERIRSKLDRLARLERYVQGRRALGFEGDDALPRERRGDSRDETAAANRHDDDVDVWQFLRDLEPTVPCPATTNGSSKGWT